MPRKGNQRFRHELKFVIDLSRGWEFLEELLPFCSYDKHVGETKSYEIASVYYDTDDLRFYYDREESIGYRRKVRLRTYNEDRKAKALFIEIKEKHQNFVSKKRINMEDMSVLEAGVPHTKLPFDLVLDSMVDSAEARELAYLHNRLELFPVVLIRYHRTPLIPNVEKDIRITLDTNITAGGDSLPCFNPDIERNVLSPDQGVVEVKSDQSIPLWLQSVLRRYSLSQVRYSKYCLGVDELYGKGAYKSFQPQVQYPEGDQQHDSAQKKISVNGS